MSEEEEENFCYFGKPLDPYDEDAFPKKRPISIEDQIATDAQGRRRFHGAFTGGFSAGFFNTVGSLEGWLPSEFKSTRQEKSKNVFQKPEDFMDQEDLEEHGIAPQTVKATKEYSTSKKRRKQVFSEGPIPGIPVLETLLTSGNETIGYLLLKKIGIKEKIKKQEENISNTKIYGCQIPNEFRIPNKIENKQYKIPEIYIDNLAKPKSNTFGIDYVGLDRSHVNLFTSSSLVLTDGYNKKMSISGQAFGVGAFEEEDDDIYTKEDMTNYDFEMKKEKPTINIKKEESMLHFGLFTPSKEPLILKKIYPPPSIPHSFTGKYKVRKSRFEPVEIKTENEEIERGAINPAIRARYLGEEPVIHTPSQPILPKQQTKKEVAASKTFDINSLMIDKFVSASNNDDTNIEPVPKQEIQHGTKDMRDAAKMNMFGPLTRITIDWAPCSVLCKRFNVPEPLIECPEQNRKRTKNLIFENQKYIDEGESVFKPGCSTSLNDEPMTTAQATEKEINLKTEDASPTEDQDMDFDAAPTESTFIDQTIKLQSEEEAANDVTEKIGIEEKVDLFKAVFLSSSESEDDDDDEQETEMDNKTEEFKETILSDLVPIIKPLKEGILSNLNFQPMQQIKENNQISQDSQTTGSILFVPKKDRNTNNRDSEPKISSYGPQLPVQKSIVSKNDIITSTVSSIISDDDEWVEKSDDKEEKNRHKKKSKKNKKKHKHSKKGK